MTDKQSAIFWGLLTVGLALIGLGFGAMSVNSNWHLPQSLPFVFFGLSFIVFVVAFVFLFRWLKAEKMRHKLETDDIRQWINQQTKLDKFKRSIPTLTLLILDLAFIVFKFHPFGIFAVNLSHDIISTPKIIVVKDNYYEFNLITNNTSAHIYTKFSLVNTGNQTIFYKVKIAVASLPNPNLIALGESLGTNPVYPQGIVSFSGDLNFPSYENQKNEQRSVFLARVVFSYSDSYGGVYLYQIPDWYTLSFDNMTKQLIIRDSYPSEVETLQKVLEGRNYEFY